MRHSVYPIKLALFLCAILSGLPLWATLAKKPWTFLVYIAADNNLNPDADLNIGQMKQIGSNANVNVLVYLNIKRPGEAKKTQKLIIHKGSVEQVGPTTSEDSGSPETLLKALSWALTDFPSDHVLIDLWDHGSGSLNRNTLPERGVCYDDTTGHYLTDLSYKHAFDQAVHTLRNGQKLDIIAFDACLMADIEVAYTLQSAFNYLVSSQETVPGAGFNYATVLAPFTTGTLTPEAFSKVLVSSYDNYYKNSGESYTISATNLMKLSGAVSSLNQTSHLLHTLLNNDPQGRIANAIIASTQAPSCPHFTEQTYIDLYSFYTNLYAAAPRMGLTFSNLYNLQASLAKAKSLLSQCVFMNAHSKDLPKASGMSIYFPDLSFGIEPSYNNLYWSTSNPEWLNLITALANRSK